MLKPGVISFSATILAVAHEQWAIALEVFLEMLERELVVGKDIHSIVYVANVLHQVEAWDDILEFSMCRFAYDSVVKRLHSFVEDMAGRSQLEVGGGLGIAATNVQSKA